VGKTTISQKDLGAIQQGAILVSHIIAEKEVEKASGASFDFEGFKALKYQLKTILSKGVSSPAHWRARFAFEARQALGEMSQRPSLALFLANYALYCAKEIALYYLSALNGHVIELSTDQLAAITSLHQVLRQYSSPLVSNLHVPYVSEELSREPQIALCEVREDGEKEEL
jgi:hypothetical protein